MPSRSRQLRIFLSCQQSLRKHPIPAYDFWEIYFKKGIEEAGHEWIEAASVDWAEGLACIDQESKEYWRSRTWTETISEIKRHHEEKGVDLFLSYLFPSQVDIQAVKDIQKLGIPCVNFFCDNVREFIEVPDSYHCFDLHWVPEYKALKLYGRAGLRFVHAPMPVWVDHAHRRCEHPENYGTTFIGSRDSQREVLFARALQLGAPIELRGPGWENGSTLDPVISDVRASRKTLTQTIINQFRSLNHQNASALLWKLVHKYRPRVADATFQGHVSGTVFGNDYIRVTQQSRITLGVSRYPSLRRSFSKPDSYSRLRDIEAPMMGACYLTEWTDGLDELYDLGREIETYRTAEEMVEKIGELESDAARRRTLRCQGQRRALSSHALSNTLSLMSNRLGISDVR